MADFSQVPTDHICSDCDYEYCSLQNISNCPKCGGKEQGWFLRFEEEVIRLDPGTRGTIHNIDILFWYRKNITIEVAAKKYIQSRKNRW